MKAKPAATKGNLVLELDNSAPALLERASLSSTHGKALFRLEKVLVPIDFSDCSLKALEYAVAFAREHDAALTLLNVSPLSDPQYAAVALLETDTTPETKAELDKLIAQKIPSNLRASAAVLSGDPAAEIVNAARENDFDLIILSTHGHTGIKHLLLGSVAEQVVRRAPCPVLVVREKEHEFLR
jgi:nucleotide-binding universal stress UspA family protein